MRSTTHPVRQPRPECAKQVVCAEELARLENTLADLATEVRATAEYGLAVGVGRWDGELEARFKVLLKHPSVLPATKRGA